MLTQYLVSIQLLAKGLICTPTTHQVYSLKYAIACEYTEYCGRNDYAQLHFEFVNTVRTP